MRQFKWIEWNLSKIDAHGLSQSEVEAAFDHVFVIRNRRDDAYEMYGETPSGRRIWVVWRYDREEKEAPNLLTDLDQPPIFVITAY